MRNQFDLQTAAELMAAINHYNQLPNYFTQLDTAQKDKLTEFWNKLYGGDYKRSQAAYPAWLRPNIHIVEQTWGNTSCGWQGIGGSAMSSSYTTVIENTHEDFIAVYYGGKLAYIAEYDQVLRDVRSRGFNSLPGVESAKKLLKIVYYGR